jgi:NAD+ kinase
MRAMDDPQLPRTFALIGKYHSAEVAESLRALAAYLEERGATVLIERETAEQVGFVSGGGAWLIAGFEDIGSHADAAIVVGGDGTMLNAARRLARFKVPMVGVNQGRLGFMTDISRKDMLTCMEDLLDGRFVPEKRLMLDIELRRKGKIMGSHLALNDVVVDKGAIGRMIELELFIDAEFIYKLRADGLILTTPTGSTAYSLSANGPILHPPMSGIGLVPLCPHSLTNRPIVVGDQANIEVRVAQGADPRLHIDGQLTIDLLPDDTISVRRAGYSICFLHPPGYSYFAMLRQKLHWNERPGAV